MNKEQKEINKLLKHIQHYIEYAKYVDTLIYSNWGLNT